jgi:hypothetical protein
MSIANITYTGSIEKLDVKPELDTAIQAAFSWLNQYIVFKGSPDVEVIIETTSTGRLSAAGLLHDYLGKVNGFDTWEHALTTESRTGIDVDPYMPELYIYIDPDSDYLQGLWWDPTPLSLTGGEIPADKMDGFSVVLHEILHGMGISGWLNQETGEHIGNNQSVWDSLITVKGDNAYFNGAHTIDLLNKPLEVRLGDSQGAYHFGGMETQQSFLQSGTMNGYYFLYGERYLPARLAFSVLEDLGWTLKPCNIYDVTDPFDDLRDGVYRIGYDSNDIINGCFENDKLEGRKGDDTLNGGSGNDIIEGGDGNDEINGEKGDDVLIGGTGHDILHAGFGRDDLTGGEGSDIFSFYAAGGFTVQDFDRSTDLLAIESGTTGLHDMEDLLAVISSIEDSNEGVIIRFINDIASVTLVGLDQSDLSASIVKFT